MWLLTGSPNRDYWRLLITFEYEFMLKKDIIKSLKT